MTHEKITGDHLKLLHTERRGGQMIHHFGLFLPSLPVSLNISKKEEKSRRKRERQIEEEKYC